LSSVIQKPDNSLQKHLKAVINVKPLKDKAFESMTNRMFTRTMLNDSGAKLKQMAQSERKHLLIESDNEEEDNEVPSALEQIRNLKH